MLLKVLAAPLNPVDVAIASGRFFAGHPTPPYVPGVEAVGQVLSDGDSVGTLVFTCLEGLGTSRDGTCADLAIAPGDRLVQLPDGIDPVLAAAIGTAGLAAWLPLTWRAPLVRGETVLVLGATGTVGLIAVQAARLLGAGRIVAAGRRREGLDLALRLGADSIVDIGSSSNLVQAFREACGKAGPSLIIDPLWGRPLVAALEASAPRAKVVQLGQSAGGSASIPSALIRGKNIDVLGYTNFNVPFDLLADGYRQLVEHVRRGRIQLEIEHVPLEQGVDAWKRQQARAGRKLVLCP